MSSVEFMFLKMEDNIMANANTNGVLQKKWSTALLLSFFLGGLGVDRFYLEKTGTGILKLLTFGGFGIWSLVDFILILTKSMPGIEWVD